MRRLLMGGTVALMLVAGGTSVFGEWGLPKVPGIGALVGSKGSGGASPMLHLVGATTSYLEGGELIMQAVGNATEAARIRAALDELDKEGDIGAVFLGKTGDISSALEGVVANEEALEKADKKKMTDAAVKVGVATYQEKLAIEASQKAVSAGDPAALTTAPLFVKLVPGNLKSMLVVQKGLFTYLKANGIDPSPGVQDAINDLERG